MSDETTVTRVIIPMPDELLNRVDDWRFASRSPSRAAAIRQLLEIALATKEHRRAST